MWCSILVRKVSSEGGAKNPSKGISMKFLVLAYDAQSWAGAGSKGDGAAAMACDN
ncbi:hypothetical protein GCM10008905_16720 [Clostridium malenominatum]|uniref:Uncharacterized protein n=1 Tax=Clostridium malenominatum TaxID=1539 RepID=A0ABN1IYJ7_9CLOT